MPHANGGSHYHVENTQRSPLTRDERASLESAYRVARHTAVMELPEHVQAWVHSSCSTALATRSCEERISPAGSSETEENAHSANVRLSAASVVASVNERFMQRVCERVHTPLIAVTSRRVVSQSAKQFALRNPFAANATIEATCASFPLLSLDEVASLLEQLKSLHQLWLSAVRMKAGSGRIRKALVMDDVYEALAALSATADTEAPSATDTLQPRRSKKQLDSISLRKIVASLAEFQLVEDSGVAQDADPSDGSPRAGDDGDADPLQFGLEAIVREVLLRDMLSHEDEDRQDLPEREEVLEGCELLPWAGAPSQNIRHVGGSNDSAWSLAGGPHPSLQQTTESVDFVDWIAKRLAEHRRQLTTPRGHRRSSMSDGTSGDLMRTSSVLSSPATPKDGGITPSPQPHRLPGLIGLTPLPLSWPRDGAAAEPLPLISLEDIDVPRCPKTQWTPGDVDSDDETAGYTTRRRLTQQRGPGHATGRLSVRGGVLPSPSSGGVRSHTVELQSILTDRRLGSGGLRAPSKEKRFQSSRPPSTSGRELRPISVGLHHSLQQPEYTRYRNSVRQVRVVQFR